MPRTGLIVRLIFLIVQLSQSAFGTRTVSSTYSNSLSMSSPTFFRPNGSAGYPYYYQAIRVIVTTSASYSLRSNSSIDTYGCLYQQWFDPSNPNQNLIRCDDETAGRGQFLIEFLLQSSQTYILVVTTYYPVTTGAYSVLAAGPATVYMASISPPPTTTTTTRPFTTPSITTTYSSRLSTNSPTFSRPGTASNNFYYEAIQTTTYTSGSYTLRSYSSIDTYACLYSPSFYPSSPDRNKLVCDDDSGGSEQFLINYYLQSGSTYALVVTTFGTSVTGYYTISASGAGSMSMTSITPVDSSSLTSGQIVAIVISCPVLFLLIALMISACKRRRRVSSVREVNFSRNTQTLPRVNLVRMPYTITKPPEYSTAIEEAPPSYEAYISSSRA